MKSPQKTGKKGAGRKPTYSALKGGAMPNGMACWGVGYLQN